MPSATDSLSLTLIPGPIIEPVILQSPDACAFHNQGVINARPFPDPHIRARCKRSGPTRQPFISLDWMKIWREPIGSQGSMARQVLLIQHLSLSDQTLFFNVPPIHPEPFESMAEEAILQYAREDLALDGHLPLTDIIQYLRLEDVRRQRL